MIWEWIKNLFGVKKNRNRTRLSKRQRKALKAPAYR